MLLLAALPRLAGGYEQSPNLLAHQWITQQAVLYYRSQFGASEVDSFLGQVQTYANGQNNRFIEGTYDEDIDRENPFNQASPFFNHFWAYNDTTYARPFDRGLGGTNDSAANRAIKLFTGGNGLTAVYDTLYGRAQGAVQDRGLVWSYRNDTGDNARKGRAYYWLGEAAHLLQDVTLPCHALNDPHPLVLDQDPVHDWVDGRAFTIASGCAFDDNTARRWERWAYVVAQKAVGRPGGTAPLESGAIRSAAQLRDLVLQQEWLASVPNGAQAQSLPLYHLFLETAGLADDFDSRDRNGQVDAGTRRVNRGRYNDWTEAKVNQVADVVVPRAMKATAELLRNFYSFVDSTPADVVIPGLSQDETAPTVVHGTAILVTATGTDAVSGVDLDGYTFQLDERGCCGYTPVATSGPDLPETGFTNLTDGLYRVRASVENGAGLESVSAYAYFRIDTAVPIEIEDFQASETPDGALLRWRLADRADVATVRVQRAPEAAGPYTDLAGASLGPDGACSFHDTQAELGRLAWYRLQIVTRTGVASVVGPVSVLAGGSSAVATWLEFPVDAADGSPIAIRYGIGAPAAVQLEIYAVDGRLVRTLARAPHAAGSYLRFWDRRDAAGTRVARGVYIVELAAGKRHLTRKLVLVRE